VRAVMTREARWYSYAWKNLRTAVRLCREREWVHARFALRAALGWIPGLSWLDAR
jgi:hypothetical protein